MFYPCTWSCNLNIHICLPWGPGKMQDPKLLASPVHSSRVLPLSLGRVSLIYLPSTLGHCLGLPCCPTLVAPWSLSISYLVRRKANLSIEYWVFGKSLFWDTGSSMTQTLPLRDSIMWLYLSYVTFFVCFAITYIWWRETWLQEASSGAAVRVSRWCRRVSGLAQTTLPSFWLTFLLGH